LTVVDEWATFGGMKALSVKLDEGTLAWLKRLAGKVQKPEATLVREWIEERRKGGTEPSCFDLMKPAWRSIKGPKDLSQREGFGE
jgi:hypothetical protein